MFVLMATLILCAIPGIATAAAESYVFDLKWGDWGDEDGLFEWPYGIAVDNEGNVYVTDTNNNRIQKFNATGSFITNWGVWGYGDGQFWCPISISVDNEGNVYVADWSNYRIQKFNTTGSFITKWGGEGSGDGKFNKPYGVAVDSEENVYVADYYNHRIQKFNATGAFILKWGSYGADDGLFNHPTGVAVDNEGNVYVSDTENHRIQKFNATGSFITKWGSPGPYGIVVDNAGNVYVSDTENHRIQKFNATGSFITKWGSKGSDDGEFNSPIGVAVSPAGHIYVTDCNNHRIQKFLLSPVTLVLPDGGETWKQGSKQVIQWNYTGDPGSTVKIELLNGEAVDHVIANATTLGPGGSGSFNWTVPDTQELGSDYKIRITSTSNPVYTDTSDAPFSIGAGVIITMVSPDGGETWKQGSNQVIQWNYTGDPGSTVKIELLNGEAVDHVIANATTLGPGGSGSFNWTVPYNQTLGSDYKIRITSTNNPVYTDTSDALFSIVAGAPITVDSPNSGERWKQGSTQTLRWDYTGDPGPGVKIEVLKGSAVRVIAQNTTIGLDGSGSFNFTFPYSAPLASDYLIRVTSTSNATYTDTSDAPFSIIPPLTVLSPNGGEEWEQGTTQTIQWDYGGDPGPSVKIEALRGDTAIAVITPKTPVGSGGTGSMTLTLPKNAPAGTTYRLRISSTSNPIYTDTSDASFSVITNTSASISLISPNGGENYLQGSPLAINWTYTGDPGPTVKIEALRGEAILAVITPATTIGSDGQGSFILNRLPYNTPLGSDYRIRVTSTSNTAWTDTGDDYFTISPAITVISPNGGSYPIGSTLPMGWTYIGSPGATVMIDVIKGNSTLKTLTGIPIGSGWYNVTIPASTPTGSDYRVRVTSTTYPACSDTSDIAFAIV